MSRSALEDVVSHILNYEGCISCIRVFFGKVYGGHDGGLVSLVWLLESYAMKPEGRIKGTRTKRTMSSISVHVVHVHA